MCKARSHDRRIVVVGSSFGRRIERVVGGRGGGGRGGGEDWGGRTGAGGLGQEDCFIRAAQLVGIALRSGEWSMSHLL